MKNFNRLMVALGVIGLVATGCAKDEPAFTGTDVEGTGKLIVRVSDGKSTRGVFDGIADAVIEGNENQINDFTAFVFEDEVGTDDPLVKTATMDNNTKEALVVGLEPATPYRVIVLANTVTAGLNFSGIDSADDLNALTIAYTTQAANGWTALGEGDFFMSGEGDSDTDTAGIQPYSLAEGVNTTAVVPVERVVAKVYLRSIQFGDAIPFTDILQFDITGSSIQLTPSHAFAGVGDFITALPAGYTYYGGYEYLGTGTSSVTGVTTDAVNLSDDASLNLSGVVNGLIDGLLTDGVVGGILALAGLDTASEIIDALLDGTLQPLLGGSLGVVESLIGGLVYDDISNAYYVLPNPHITPDVTTNLPTLLTLKGKFREEDYYYPIAINWAATASTSDNADGSGILRNHEYYIDLTFTSSLAGTKDPNSTEPLTNLIVEVTPVDWEGPINQDATW